MTQKKHRDLGYTQSPGHDGRGDALASSHGKGAYRSIVRDSPSPSGAASRGSGLEESQHRQDPSMIGLGHRQAELREDVGDMFLDRAVRYHERGSRWRRWSVPRP